MKYKIAKRLNLYFATTLIIFSIVMGAVFFGLFTTYTTKMYKEDLEKRAVTIANTLSEYMSNEEELEEEKSPGKGYGQSKGNGKGYGAYLRFIGDIAMSEAWLVDETGQMITVEHEQAAINYSKLPPDVDQLIKKVFDGETLTSKIIDKSSLVVGTPVYGADGKVIAALLLHTHMDGVSAATKMGMGILLICLAIALVLTIGISTLLARRFIYPLKKMAEATAALAKGNYQMETKINQKDEIGLLAENIDILAKRLDSASKESGRLEKMRDDFIMNISHELRTPVTVVRGSIEALIDKVITEPNQIEEYYRQILEESVYLQQMVNDLLELSRLQNIDYKIEKRELNILDVVDDAVRSMRKIASDKKIIISYNKEVTQYLILGDYGRLRQMFIIVIDNAIKFSENNSEIIVNVGAVDKKLRVEVVDFGCGISAKEIEQIFYRFKKATNENNKTGTGLGLPIAKEIAERHNATITAKSTEKEKTAFYFLFNSN